MVNAVKKRDKVPSSAPKRKQRMVCLMSEEDRKKFAEQYQFLRNILKRNFWYVIFCSKIRLKPRIKLAMDIYKQ